MEFLFSCSIQHLTRPWLFFIYLRVWGFLRYGTFTANISSFTWLWQLQEALSCGEYNHLFISIACFLRTTNSSVHRFNVLIFFSCRTKSTRIIFLLLKNIDYGNRVLKIPDFRFFKTTLYKLSASTVVNLRNWNKEWWKVKRLALKYEYRDKKWFAVCYSPLPNVK